MSKVIYYLFSDMLRYYNIFVTLLQGILEECDQNNDRKISWDEFKRAAIL